MGKLQITDLIPDFVKKLISGDRLLPISGHEVYRRILDQPVTILAVNVRFLQTIPGILRAAEETDAIVSFDLGTEAANIEGGFTGLTPQVFVESLFAMMERANFTKPFILHSDHIQRPDSPPIDIEATKELFRAEHRLGFTSFSVDATTTESYLPNTIELASEISRWRVGLEIAMDEIEGTRGELSSVEECMETVTALHREAIRPDLLAISNGGKQGNYRKSETSALDLDRTQQIFNAIRDNNIAIAQHGVTGIPLPVMSQFPRHGIRKANTATIWQNLVHQNLPTELYDRMKYWSDIEGKDIRYTTLRFKDELDALPSEILHEIEQNTYAAATELIEALASDGSASLLEGLL